jgi:serine protease inhibitor
MTYARLIRFPVLILIAATSFSNAREAKELRGSSIASTADKTNEWSEQYGIRVFNRVLSAGSDSAVVLSPYTLKSALNILALGAEGGTATFFRQQGLMPVQSKDQNGASIWRSLFRESNADSTLQIANSVWLKPTSRVRSSFARVIWRAYAAEVIRIDLARRDAAIRINEWVNRATKQLIPKVLDNMNPSTQLALVNTIYFKGTVPFDLANTKTSEFTRLDGTKSDVAMMNTTRTLLYAETPTWHTVAMPYGGNRFQIIVATSKNADKATEFKNEIVNSGFIRSLSQLKMQETKVSLQLPRFKMEYGADLTSTLSFLGLGRAFDPGANYRRITKGGVRSVSIIHRSVVDVAEEGTNAEAGKSHDRASVTVTIDHPFLFMITDKFTHTVLFVGYVEEPVSTREIPIVWTEVPDKSWVRFKSHTYTYAGAQTTARLIEEVDEGTAHHIADGTRIYMGAQQGKVLWYRYQRDAGSHQTRFVFAEKVELR